MAQQSTQFPPGGSLLNWTPGFSLGGSPIRGIKVDNTSGSWLNIQIPGLPVQYIPPYTLAWSMTLLTPLNNVTILSGGPFGSISTNSGSNVSVYAYDQSQGDSNGNTYYTPVAEPSKTFLQLFMAGIGPITSITMPALLPLPLKSYRIYLVSFSNEDSYPTTSPGMTINDTLVPFGHVVLTPAEPSITIYPDVTLAPGRGVNVVWDNNSTTTTSDYSAVIVYGII